MYYINTPYDCQAKTVIFIKNKIFLLKNKKLKTQYYVLAYSIFNRPTLKGGRLHYEI